MKFKAEQAWKLNRSVLRKGTAPGGQIIYKGQVPGYDEDQDGNRVQVKRHKFMVRVGKRPAEVVEGTPNDAANRLVTMLGRARSGSLVRRPRLRLKAYLTNHFLPACRLAVAPKTYSHYKQDINNHIIPALGSRLLNDLPAEALQAFVSALRQEKGFSTKHAKNIYGVLKTALNQAVAGGLIESHDATMEKVNLRRLLKQSKVERAETNATKRLLPWSFAELCHFISVAPKGHELTRLAVVGCRTGMRPGELCARTWDDLKEDRLEIWTSVFENDKDSLEADASLRRWEVGDIKAGEGRAIVLDPETMHALDEQRNFVQSLVEQGTISEEAARFIFPAHGGANPYINPAKMYERWRFFINGNKNKAVEDRDPKKGGRPRREPLKGVRMISLYGYRHTHATELLRGREPVKVVAERLGTSEEMIHRHYGHILAETSARAVANLPPIGYAAEEPDGTG